MVNFIKKVVGKKETKESSCCGVEIQEVNVSNDDSCCGVDSSENDNSCCGVEEEKSSDNSCCG
jgi:hypothetical protein